MLTSARAACTLVLMIALGMPLQAQTEERFEEAEQRFQAGAYQLALEQFSQLLRDVPESAFTLQAQLRLGQSHYFLGDYDAARDVLERALVRAGSGRVGREVRFWFGLASYQLGDDDIASAALERYRSDGGDQIGRASLYLGLIARRNGETAVAIGELARGEPLLAPQERLFALATLMELESENRQWQRVLEFAELAQEIDPQFRDETSELRLRLEADAAWELDEVEKARALYEQLTEFSTASAQWAYRRLYALAEESGDRAATQRVFRSAEQRLAGEPARLSAFWSALGRDAVERGQFELAELYLVRVWDVRDRQPVSGSVPLLLARTVEQLGRPAEALEILTGSLEDPQVGTERELDRRREAARLALEVEDLDTAVDLLDTFAPARRRSDTLYLLAFALDGAGQSARALELVTANEAQPLVREFPALQYLQARLLLESGASSEAVRAYRFYLAGARANLRARLDLVRALLGARQYSAALQESQLLGEQELPAAWREEYAFFHGLAAFQTGDFESAADLLASVQSPIWDPMRTYHLAWARYRLGDTEASAQLMGSVVDTVPADLRYQAGYVLAWSEYQNGRYPAAVDELLRLLGLSATRAQEVQVRRLLVSAYIQQRAMADALGQYQTLIQLAPAGEQRASVWSEYASLLASLGNVEAAIAEYEDLRQSFPETESGRAALLDAGQLDYTEGRLAEARDRFRRFQSLYPEAPEIDRALYWAGLASLELDEPARALLWWEPLIENFPRSPFAAGAMFGTASILADRGQRRAAIELYDRFSAAFPGDPRAAEADEIRRRLRLQLDGLSEREAELWVQLDPPRGEPPQPGSSSWYDIVLELARIAIREQLTLSTDRFRIIPFLDDAAEFDRAEAAEAQVLLAEFYRRRGDDAEAIRRYLAASANTLAPDELRAQSLYELALLARGAGDSGAADRAIDELRQRYPQSIWAERAVSPQERAE